MAPSVPRDLHGNRIREGERERGEQKGEQSEQRRGLWSVCPRCPVVSDNRLAAKPAALGKKRKQCIEHVVGGTACFLTAD